MNRLPEAKQEVQLYAKLSMIRKEGYFQIYLFQQIGACMSVRIAFTIPFTFAKWTHVILILHFLLLRKSFDMIAMQLLGDLVVWGFFILFGFVSKNF